MKEGKVIKGGWVGENAIEGQYSLLDRGKNRRTDTHWEMEGGRRKRRDERWMDGWMDKKSWHGVRVHLVGEFWVILLTMEPPFPD